MTKIFESPDGGHTVYVRDAGSDKKELFFEDNIAIDRKNQQEWNKIWHHKDSNPALQRAMEQVIILYRLGKNNE